jgi:lysozyme
MIIIGTDISAWQDKDETYGKVDFDKMAAAGAKFCFMRAYFGLTRDEDFADYWLAAKGKIARGAYFFPLTTGSIVDQVNNFVNLLKSDGGELPPVIDIERFNGTVPNASAIKVCIQVIEQKLAVKPIIYTGRYMWQDEVVGGSDPYFANYDLWIAAYGYASPKIPAPWTDWKFWQYTDKGDGLKFGVESLNIDMDYFNGDQNQFDSYINMVPSPVDPAVLTFRATREMNIRTGPGMRFAKVSTLPAQSIITPLDVTGAEVWVKIDQGWVCKKQGETIYLV